MVNENDNDDLAELAYLAGLFDGDGSVMHLAGRKMALAVGMNDSDMARRLLKGFARRFGGSVGKSSQQNLKVGWRCGGQGAADALRVLLPYLYIKRPKGILALASRHALVTGLSAYALPRTRAALADSSQRRMPPRPDLLEDALSELSDSGDPELTRIAGLYRTQHPALSGAQAIAWSAGVFDAEGHITLCPNDAGRTFWKWAAGWSQAESREADRMLTALAAVVGGNRATNKYKSKIVWQLLIGQQEMFSPLCAMYPYLLLKKEQAGWVIRLLAVGRVTDDRVDVRGSAFVAVSRVLTLLKAATHQRLAERQRALRQLPHARATAKKELADVGAPDIPEILRAQRAGTILPSRFSVRNRMGPFELRDGHVYRDGVRHFTDSGIRKDRLLGELIRRPGGVSKENLRAAGWGDAQNAQAIEHLRVHVYQLRDQLAASGLGIATLGRWGYQLVNRAGSASAT